MHTFFILIQYFGLITLFLGTLFILKQKPSKQQNLMLMLYVGTVIDFVGYLFELKATNLNEAMFAIQVSYIGKPVITIAMLLFCLSYCKVKKGAFRTFSIALCSKKEDKLIWELWHMPHLWWA